MLRKRILLGLAIMSSLSLFAQKTEKPFALDLDGGRESYSAPAMADLDNDGKKDLVVGLWSGKFRFYKNQGTNANPKFDEFTLLQAGGADAQVPNW